MKTKITTLCILLCSMYLSAQNPIVPPGMYIADPEAHVWKDGKLYIYGSRDEAEEYWCSYDHHVLSTTDMVNWSVEENAFSSKGPNDEVADNDKLLFAPDCAYKNGTYFLYYCSPGNVLGGEGVATSKSPNGPFINGTTIKGAYKIDPAVLVDDDGQAYYYWGQGDPKAAKLTDNMMAIDTTTIVHPLVKTPVRVFHEGSSIRKIGDTYYFVFADESRNKTPSCLGYATSKSPLGPFVYQGVIIDNIGSDAKVWNNHGSIEEFNGKWYVFYHRSTHGTRKFRKACIEPITINKDGSITEVEMTSQGAGAPLNAFDKIQAERACGVTGNARVEDFKAKDMWYGKLAKMKSGDHAAYKYLDFKDGVTNFSLKSLGETKGGKVEIWIDAINTGKHVGTCDVSSFNNGLSYQVAATEIKKTKGVHAVYLKFVGDEESMLDIDWFSFEK